VPRASEPLQRLGGGGLVRHGPLMGGLGLLTDRTDLNSATFRVLPLRPRRPASCTHVCRRPASYRRDLSVASHRPCGSARTPSSTWRYCRCPRPDGPSPSAGRGRCRTSPSP
jgi:hypothetical protein